ncbi:carbohydrate ABC transporter permease [Naasia sp. SYSU D00948]|uniref:carbohydrate ABC transporter permease n=1 Tax=Naasia sp. SYSU D00948 TaxID=2817379 RepID=UPI001B30CD22|nr:sugar ABC transporter permease [Naasia sp. SYSU D00948]
MTANQAAMRRSGSASRADRRAAAILLAPSTAGLVAFFLVPIGVVLWLVTQSWDLLGEPTWVGLGNLTALLRDEGFGRSLLVTLGMGLIAVPLQVLLGLALAVALARPVPGSALFGAALLLPWLAAPLVVGVLWRWILSPVGGVIPELTGRTVDLLGDPVLAPVLVSLVVVWSNVGYVTLFFVAALVAIPREYEETAMLEGAGRLRRLWSVELPLIRPTLFFVLITSCVSFFGLFDTVVALTGGGPGAATDVVALHVYRAAFEEFDLGRAAAMALVLGGIQAVLLVVQWRLLRSER